MKYSHLHGKQETKNIQHIKSILKKGLIIAIILCMGLNSPALMKISKADATTTVNAVVNYLDEVVNVYSGPGSSTKFYISTDNQKNWEVIDTGLMVSNGKNMCVMDISSLLTTKEATIFFKGNKDGNPYKLILQGEDSKSLTAVYKVMAGEGRIDFTSVLPVEYRKGTNGIWKPVTSPMLTSIYEIKGANLFFRTIATADRRAGKVITVKVPKRPTAPSVKLDGSKLNITGVKVGSTQYRKGDDAGWITFNTPDTKIKTIDLSSLLGGSTAINMPIPAGVIEFRTLGTDKKPNSAIKVIEVPQQRIMPVSQASLIGSALAIIDPNTKNQYEYTIVSPGVTLNLNTAKWSSITSAKAVIIPKVAINDRILVRMKSTTDSLTKQIIPASTYIELTVTSITPRS